MNLYFALYFSVLSSDSSGFCFLQDRDLAALREISVIVRDSDVSAFEVIHSGLVNKMLQYLTLQDPHLRDLRIRRFLHVFLGCPVRDMNSAIGCHFWMVILCCY